MGRDRSQIFVANRVDVVKHIEEQLAGRENADIIVITNLSNLICSLGRRPASPRALRKDSRPITGLRTGECSARESIPSHFRLVALKGLLKHLSTL